MNRAIELRRVNLFSFCVIFIYSKMVLLTCFEKNTKEKMTEIEIVRLKKVLAYRYSENE